MYAPCNKEPKSFFYLKSAAETSSDNKIIGYWADSISLESTFA